LTSSQHRAGHVRHNSTQYEGLTNGLGLPNSEGRKDKADMTNLGQAERDNDVNIHKVVPI